MEVGARVNVNGRIGLLATDNGDGTWCVELSDGDDTDIAEQDLVLAGELCLSQLPANVAPEDHMARQAARELSTGIRIVDDPWAEAKPEGWTRFVCFSDTHGLHGTIPRRHRPPADVLLHAGDFTNTGELEQVKSFAEWLEAYPCSHRVVIAGNHDVTFHEEYYRDRGAPRFHRNAPYDCGKAKGFFAKCIYLEDAAAEVCGYSVYGSPWQPEFCDWAFNLARGEECREKWDLIPESTDILITHGPPANYGDLCSHGARAGCVDLLGAIRDRCIPVSVSGHIHEGYGCSADHATLYINASTCTHGYVASNPPIVFDAPPPDQLRAAVERVVSRLGVKRQDHDELLPGQGAAAESVDPSELV